jgi:glycerate 2-kinase
MAEPSCSSRSEPQNEGPFDLKTPEALFRDYPTLTVTDPYGHKKLILDCLVFAIESVQPQNLMENRISLDSEEILRIRDTNLEFPLRSYDELIVVGAGKASGAMAVSLETLLSQKIAFSGVVIVPEGISKKYPTNRIKLLEGSHPIPSSRSVEATKEVLKLVRNATEKSLVLCLISGGGSALMTLPANGISLKDQIRTTTLLLKSGASIEKVNCVRKHLSSVKGGLLALAANGSRIISLIISDIVGNPIGSIASGPTAPDPTTFGGALQILQDYQVSKRVPNKVLRRLREGAAGRLPETPKPGNPVFSKVTNFILGDNSVACLAGIKALNKNSSMHVTYLGSSWQGESRDTAANLTGIFLAARHYQTVPGERGPKAFFWGGETTVTVRGKGRGGRNQEEALSSLIRLGDEKGITIAFVGTDGIDGFSSSAGAVIDESSNGRAQSKKLRPEAYLRNNDSNSFFRKLGKSLLVTGPTGTNVNDIGIAIVEPKSDQD